MRLAVWIWAHFFIFRATRITFNKSIFDHAFDKPIFDYIFDISISITHLINQFRLHALHSIDRFSTAHLINRFSTTHLITSRTPPRCSVSVSVAMALYHLKLRGFMPPGGMPTTEGGLFACFLGEFIGILLRFTLFLLVLKANSQAFLYFFALVLLGFLGECIRIPLLFFTLAHLFLRVCLFFTRIYSIGIPLLLFTLAFSLVFRATL